MPPSVSLGTYQLFVTERGEQRVLSDLTPTPFLTWCRAALSSTELRGLGAEDGARHACEPPQLSGTHTIYGRIHSGESGFGSRLVHATTGADSYRRRVADAELIPFYYQLYAPTGSPLSILVLQKFGNRSPYSFFKDELRRAFSDAFQGLSLHIQPMVSKEVLTRLQHGVVSEVKFTKFSPPRDVDRFVRNHGLTGEDVYYETRIVARKGRAINLGRELKRLVNGLSSRNAVEAPEGWSDYGDEIRVKLKHGGRDRTLSFGDGREVNPYEDVTDRIRRDRDKHPTVQSIHPIADELVSGLREEMRIRHVE